MAVSAGGAVLQVTPQLVKTFSRDLTNQLAGPAVRTANKAGTEAGRTFGRRFGFGLRGPAGKASEQAGRESGSRFGKLFSRSTEKAGHDAGKRSGLRFSTGLRTGIGPVRGIMRGFGPALATAFGATALIAGIKDVTDEAREAAVVGRITEARLKSTGGVANVTAGHVSGLAERLSNLVGADDELIQSGENLMLTFKGVRNQVGAGNDIFDQATKLSVDLAAGMNNGAITANGLKTANIQLGKALEDPIKGITALRRSGVSFTDQQKDQIKTLVASGNTLGAQKIILKAVQEQFGGTAAASADAGKRFGVFIGNLKEKIGAVLLPVINRLLGFLVDKLPGALATVGHWFKVARLGVDSLTDAFGGNGITTEAGNFFGIMERIGVALRSVWDWIKKTAGTLAGILGPAFRSIVASVQPAIGVFVRGLLPGLGSLWHVVKGQVLPALKLIAVVIGVTLFAALKFVLPLLLRIAGPTLGFLIKVLAQAIQWLGNLIRWIGRVGAWLLRWITGTKTTGAAIAELGRRVGVFASNMAKQWRSITTQIGNALGFLKRTTISVLSFMIRMWLRWAGNIIDAAAHAMGWVPGIGPKLRTAAAKFHTFADSVNRALNSIDDERVNVTARAGITWTAEAAKFKQAAGRMAAGGLVRGPGGPTADKVPIMASAGEAVVPARLVPEVAPFLAANGVPGFARGGLIPGVTTTNTIKPGDIQRMATGLAKRLGAAVGKKLTKAMAALGGGSAAIKAFIRSVDSHPYVWGGAGPWGYDCSGLVGAVYGKMKGLRGAGHGARYFTTSTIGGMGLPRGPGGTLQIGVTPGHHMAGRYGGLGFEAESTRTGIKIGAAASRPESFPVMYHMAQGGRVVRDLARIPGVDIGGDPSGLWLRKNKDIGIFDRGGMLMPGQLGANLTSRPEMVLPPGQGMGGIDYDKLGRAVALALAAHPPRAYLNPNDARQGIREAQRHGGIPKREQLR